MSRIERVREVRKEGGVPLVLFRIFHKLLSHLLDFGSTIFFSIELEARERWSRPVPSFSCFQARLVDAVRLLEASDSTRTLDQIEERFRQGNVCFAAATHEGRVIHTCWCAYDEAHIGELSRDVRLSPYEVYVYDSYTHPDFRGLGAAGEVHGFVSDTLASRGYTRMHAFVRGDNLLGLRVVKPTHRRTGTLYYFRFLGFRPIVFGENLNEIPLLAIPNTQRTSAKPGLA